jgi:hypothetical protein
MMIDNVSKRLNIEQVAVHTFFNSPDILPEKKSDLDKCSIF